MRCPFCGHEDTQVKDSRPAEDSATKPLVTDAGDTDDTSACAGSMKSTSVRLVSARASSSLTFVSALGVENRANSFVMAAIVPTFVKPSDT